MQDSEPLCFVSPTIDEHRRDVFVVLTKRTYDLVHGQTPVRADEDLPFREVDSLFDGEDPLNSTVEFESELSPIKLGTDVVVCGKAYAANQEAVYQLTAAVQVGQTAKSVLVTGNRRCIHRPDGPPSFTDPEPFQVMDLRYDYAYGGIDDQSIAPMELYYPRNPQGKGLVVKNVREAVDGLELPNIEDPQDILTPERVVLGEVDRWNGQPLPSGFGWYQKTWYPRCSFVGAMPGFVDPNIPMREEALGLVPSNHVELARRFQLPSYDVRFNHGASHGLHFPYLSPGESIRLINLTADGELSFSLPAETPAISMDIGEGPVDLDVYLQTVLIRVEDRQLDLVWRGALEYPGPEWLPNMTCFEALVQ